MECGKEFVNEKNEPTPSPFEFCGETTLTQGPCNRAWLAKHPHRELPKPEPHTISALELDDLHVDEQKEWGRRRLLNLPSGLNQPLTNFCPALGAYTQQNGELRVGGEPRIDYAALVKEYSAKNMRELEDACEFRHYASVFWKFRVAFEFPKVYDKEVMEEAAKAIINTFDREHLAALLGVATKRGLLHRGYTDTELLNALCSVRLTNYKGKRHYVRHGAGDEVSFVRQQDLNLATDSCL